MNLGTGYIVTIPNTESGEKLLSILRRRPENYPIVCRQARPRYIPSRKRLRVQISDYTKYPQDWLVSSLDGFFLTLSSGTQEIKGLGLIIREATEKDLPRFLPNLPPGEIDKLEEGKE